MGNKVSSNNGVKNTFKKQPRIHKPIIKKGRKLRRTRIKTIQQPSHLFIEPIDLLRTSRYSSM